MSWYSCTNIILQYTKSIYRELVPHIYNSIAEIVSSYVEPDFFLYILKGCPLGPVYYYIMISLYLSTWSISFIIL